MRDARDLAEKEKSPDEALEFYKELKQIYKSAKMIEKHLKTENRASVYAAYVKRLDSFASGDWNYPEV